MKETLVVIPYYAAGAQGNELELAVEGWRQHFRDPHRIVIVGDWHPIVGHITPNGEVLSGNFAEEWAKYDGEIKYIERRSEMEGHNITFVPCPRIDPVEGQYLPHLDMVNKFLKVMEAFPDYVWFIYSCDDIYAVRDFSLADVQVPKISSREVPPIDYRKEKDWFKDLGKTRELCAKEGWPTMNWVCHLPVYYNADILRTMYRMYNAAEESYVWENIYFNFRNWNQRRCMGGVIGAKYGINPEFIPETGGPWKYGVQTSSPDFSTVEETGAVWITNSNSGWSPRLEEILRSHYGLS